MDAKPAPNPTQQFDSEFPIIIRGGAEIDAGRDDTRADLSALLALGLRLENVGIFLGAGASCGAGGKTMRQLWSELESSCPATIEWLAKEDLIDVLDNTTPNIEVIASKVDLTVDAYRQAWGETDDDYLAALTHRTEIQRLVTRAALLDDRFWTTRPDINDSAFKKLRHHSLLLSRLLGSRQPGQNSPWIFTTNYDLAIEWAAELLGIHVVSGFSGMHYRHFEPTCFDLGLMNLQGRGEARFGAYNLFLAKLHGSLSWLQRGDDLIERPAREAWSEINDFANGSSESCPATIILPNTAKYVDTTGFVYGEMLRRFSEFLSRRSTLLIVSGYGFGDEHINRLLLSGLRNPTLQLIVYLPELVDPSQMPNRVVSQLNELKTKQVILVGGAENAWFSKLANDLPDPGYLDATAEEARKLAQAIASLTKTPQTDDAPK